MIKVLKSTLRTGDYIGDPQGIDVKFNEILMNEELMDDLDIVDGEAVDLNCGLNQYRAYVSKSNIEELVIGFPVMGKIIITSYRITDREGTLFNPSPIRLDW